LLYSLELFKIQQRIKKLIGITMKKIFCAFGLLALTSFSSFAQGTVNFDNLGTGQPIYLYPGGAGAGTGPSARAALFMNGVLIPDSITTFFSTTDPGAMYLSSIVVAIPGVTPGASATLQAGAWIGGPTFDDAIARGFSEPFSVVTGGAGEPPTLPGDTTFKSFSIVVPEPSSIALGLLGACALLFSRRVAKLRNG
jgi:hypothetical protein